MKGRLGAFQRASKDYLKRTLRRVVRGQPPDHPGILPAYFGLTRGDRGRLGWGGVDLSELGRTQGTPLHVVSLPRLHDNARRFVGATPAQASCETFYSYKTNPVPAVLRQLHDLGLGAEVISHYELWLALELGVPPSSIIYNGPAKSEESLRLAIARDILLLNLNHREEIATVAAVAGELGKRARVGLRITLSGWAGQFGTPASGGRGLAAYREAYADPRLDVVGLHVHRGGMLRNETEALQFIDEVLAFIASLHREFDRSIQMLDLGGSLCSPSVRGLSARELRLNRTFLRDLEAPEPAEALRPERYVQLVRERVDAHFRAAGRPPPRIFLEPGRSVTSDTQLLLTRVIQLKEEGETTFAVLDAGINLAESCRSEYHQVFHVEKADEASTQTYTLVGPICTPGDTLRWAIRLPKLTVGDTLAIMDAGAYFVPFSTAFSFPRPGIVAIGDGRVSELRRAETFADLLRLDASAIAKE